MLNTRASGVLMHLSSLPSPYGIGVMGEETKRFIRKIKDMGFSYWQVLPLNPPDFYGSPYASNAAFAISYLFIDPRGLVRDRLVKEDEILKLAFSRISPEMHEKIEDFCNAHHWCEAYTLYGAAKERFGGKPWYEWDEPFARYETAVQHADELKAAQDFFKFVQYTAFTQWREIKQYANENGVKILGDMPIYVSFDSADVWENRHLFEIDDRTFIRKRVSGVPPDYFSEDGQLWGNPLYDWVAMEKDNYRWWCERIRAALQLYDTVRIDHFRGLDRYYEVDAGEKTAVNGEWQDGPKDELFEGIDKTRIIAEDLGEIDDGVRSLIKRTGLPGMKVLLFAFDGNEENAFLPHNIDKNCVAYTGTHDNDTVAGYVKSLSPEEFLLFRSRVAKELDLVGMDIRLGRTPESFTKAFTEIALASKANLAVVPVQDLLGLDNSCRMNHPGTNGGNWVWRRRKLPSGVVFGRLKRLIRKYRK